MLRVCGVAMWHRLVVGVLHLLLHLGGRHRGTSGRAEGRIWMLSHGALALEGSAHVGTSSLLVGQLSERGDRRVVDGWAVARRELTPITAVGLVAAIHGGVAHVAVCGL